MVISHETFRQENLQTSLTKNFKCGGKYMFEKRYKNSIINSLTTVMQV